MYKSAAIRFDIQTNAGTPAEARLELMGEMRKVFPRSVELDWSGFVYGSGMTNDNLAAELDMTVESGIYLNVPQNKVKVQVPGTPTWEEIGASHETKRAILVQSGGSWVPLVFTATVQGTEYNAAALAVYSTTRVTLLG